MKSIKEGLIALASSPKNTSVIRKFLKEIAEGSELPKPITTGVGCTQTEAEFFNRVVSSNRKVTFENGLLKADGKIIAFETIHCDMFQLFTKEFCIQNTRALKTLLKDDFVLLDKKIVNNHKKCKCFQNTFTKFNKVRPIQVRYTHLCSRTHAYIYI